jgi:hypothetical protein
MGSHGNLSPHVKKSRNTTTLLASRVGTCSSEGGCASPMGKNPAASYLLIRSAVTLIPQTQRLEHKILYSSR